MDEVSHMPSFEDGVGAPTTAYEPVEEERAPRERTEAAGEMEGEEAEAGEAEAGEAVGKVDKFAPGRAEEDGEEEVEEAGDEETPGAAAAAGEGERAEAAEAEAEEEEDEGEDENDSAEDEDEGENGGMNAYERQRQANIERNQKALEALGLLGGGKGLLRPERQKDRKTYEKKVWEKKDRGAVARRAVRQPDRLDPSTGQTRVAYEEEKDEPHPTRPSSLRLEQARRNAAAAMRALGMGANGSAFRAWGAPQASTAEGGPPGAVGAPLGSAATFGGGAFAGAPVNVPVEMMGTRGETAKGTIYEHVYYKAAINPKVQRCPSCRSVNTRKLENGSDETRRVRFTCDDCKHEWLMNTCSMCRQPKKGHM